jgi:CubicO group peptidase (beta-lactamase class C family)
MTITRTLNRRTLLRWAASVPLAPKRRRRSIDAPVLDPVFTQARSLDRLTSLAVYSEGRLVRQLFQNGLSDDLTLTNVKSVSKSILGLLIGIAIDRRHIRSVDDRLARYLPTKFTPASGLDHLTIRHLLTMTGNLAPAHRAGWAELVASPDWVDHLVGKGPTGTLGQFRYSTGDTHLLSVVLTHAAGMSTLAFAERHLFAPLGITEVRWQTDPQGYYRGGNDLFLCTRDLGRIGQLTLNEGRYQGKRVVSARWMRASTRKQTEISEAEGDPMGKLGLDGYGYLWWTMKLAGQDAHVAWGWGRQYVVVIPALRVVVVLTSTTDNPPPAPYHRAVAGLIDPVIADALASAG